MADMYHMPLGLRTVSRKSTIASQYTATPSLEKCKGHPRLSCCLCSDKHAIGYSRWSFNHKAGHV